MAVIDNVFLLDGWLVDIPGGQISRNEVKERLEPQVMKVLSYLSARPSAVVTREELFENLWDHSFVGDAALTRCIFEIRRAFRDDPRKPRIVETIPSEIRQLTPSRPDFAGYGLTHCQAGCSEGVPVSHWILHPNKA